jgi:uncharacterized membrane protein YhfC
MPSVGLGLLVVAGLLVPIVAWAVGRSGGLGGVAWPRLIIGAVAVSGASMAQNILVAPVALLIHGPHGLQPLIPASAAEALYYGFAAGLAQEGAKLAGIQLYQRRGAIVPTAIAVGAGFALIEILFVSLGAFGTRLDSLQALVVPVWERGSAILFHIGAALIIAAGLLRGRPWPSLVVAIVLHGIVDGTVGLMAVADVHPILAFETANLLFSLIVLGLGMRLVRAAADPDRGLDRGGPP